MGGEIAVVDLLVLLIAFLVHEWGHIIPLWIWVGRLPPVKITKFFSIVVGNQKFCKDLTFRQVGFVAFAGIVAGLVPLTVFQNWFTLFLYCVACCFDISTIVIFFNSNGVADVKVKDLVLKIGKRGEVEKSV